MIEWVPWLLILVSWHQDSPDDQQVVAVKVAIDQTECEVRGESYLGSQPAAAEESDPYQYRFFCIAMPDRASFDAAIERWSDERRKPVRPE